MIVILVLISLLGSFFIPIIILPETKTISDDVGTRSTLTVGGSGDYSKIQDAIDAAKSGDTIQIGDGTFKENILVDKSLTIIGSGPDRTIIDGRERSDVIKITADKCMIKDLKAMRAGDGNPTAGIYVGDSFAGINIASSENTIEDCYVSDCLEMGFKVLYVRKGYERDKPINNLIRNCKSQNNNLYGLYSSNSDGLEIIGSRFEDNYHGIGISQSMDVLVEDCTILDNRDDGLDIDTYSENVEVKDTICNNNGRSGIDVDGEHIKLKDCVTNNNQFAGVYVSGEFCMFDGIETNGNKQYGFFLYHSSNGTIKDCTSNYNEYGLVFSCSDDYKVTRNLFGYNEDEGLSLMFGYNKRNYIYNNSFVKNNAGRKSQAEDDNGLSYWSKDGQGNYWSNLKIVDKNKDGINDIPYYIEREGKDEYPLTKPHDPDVLKKKNVLEEPGTITFILVDIIIILVIGGAIAMIVYWNKRKKK